MNSGFKTAFLLTGWIFCTSLGLPAAETGPVVPFFENPQTLSVVGTEGQTVYLDCKVFQIGGKTVTWARHYNRTIELITYGLSPFHDDRRFIVRYEPPQNWRLRIRALRMGDSGKYVCQISTDPPLKKIVFLKVINPQITVRDRHSLPIRKSYSLNGGDISFECLAEPVSVYTKTLPFWTFNNSRLKPKIGKLWTERVRRENSFSLWLHLTDIQSTDGGLYTCATEGSKGRSVILHVINDNSSGATQPSPQFIYIAMMSFLISHRVDR